MKDLSFRKDYLYPPSHEKRSDQFRKLSLHISRYENEKMMQDYDKLKPSMMTCLLYLSQSIALNVLFSFLNADIPDLSEAQKRIKIELPVHSPGTILSMVFNFNGMVFKKGVVKNENSKGFQNAILIDISTTSRNVHIMLFHNLINIKNVPSVEVAIEAASHIMRRIEQVQRYLNLLRVDPQKTLDDSTKLLDWMCEGHKVLRVINQDYRFDEVLGKTPLPSLESPTKPLFSSEARKKLDETDSNISSFLFSVYNQYTYRSETKQVTGWLLNTENNVVRLPLEIVQLDKALVTYDLNLIPGLNYKIDREKLAALFNRPDLGWYSRFRPETNPDVFIYFPFSQDHPSVRGRKFKSKNDPPKISFRIRHTGNMTLYGPDGDITRDVYNSFKTILVMKLREVIIC